MLCFTVNETGQLAQAAQLLNSAGCYAVVKSVAPVQVKQQA